jgi:hypothetical protein
MSEKWTPEERSAAESYAWGCQTGGKRPVTLLEVELACQRNRLLVALKEAQVYVLSYHKRLWECEFIDQGASPAAQKIAEVAEQVDAAIAACEGKL